MKAFVVGFPKSGTSTLHRALEASGIASAHWDVPSGFVGEIIYRNVAAGRDPFTGLEAYQAVTQADVCLPADGLNYWPNLDFAIIETIRAWHPECRFVLNYRDPAATVGTMRRWSDMVDRFRIAEIPGLPAGRGSTDAELIAWIEGHYARTRAFFADDPRFLELDIAAADAPQTLGDYLGVTIAWWGKANAGALKIPAVRLRQGGRGRCH